MNPFNRKPEVTLDTVRQTVGLVKKVASKQGGFAGSSSTAGDPTGCDHLAGLDKIPPLVRGFVVRSGIGSYDCEVQIDGGQTVVCSTLAPVLHDTYGVSQACLPVPGSCVLVFVPAVGLSQRRVVRGIILGVIPENRAHGAAPVGSNTVRKVPDTEFPEGGVAQFTEAGPAAVASDTQFPYKGEFQCGRPHDLVPGEYALTNHAGAGIVIGALSTTVKGSETASVRCSALDDQVRVTSGHFRHISAAGSKEIFNDGGFISVESCVSMYQPERLGVKNDGTAAFTWSPSDAASLQERRSGVDPLKPTQTAKKRLYRYSGYLGDIVNVFVANPDPEKDVEDMASESKDQGLLHYHVDTSGRFTMRSAGGILLERFDRIPVPKRTHYAWDPEGDHAADGTPEKKTPFTVDSKYPLAIGPVLGDMAAWWNRQAYARFLQFGKDFSVRDQEELNCPDDDYDTLGKGSENYQEYDTRHSYIGLTPNGGIVLRDAWGSEIVMADGRITLNAAANIEIRSGSSVVLLGGDDVVAKAYNSLDLSATKKDVRVKAENNLQLVSMTKGVLIQSKAPSMGQPEWSQIGENLQSTGVVIKADNSVVALAGKKASVQGTSGVDVAAFDGDGKPSGNIVLSGKQVSAVAESNVIASAKGTSGLVVGEQSAILCAPSVMMIGGRSAAEAAGKNMLIGIPVDIGIENLYAKVASIYKSLMETYLSSVDWLSPVPPKAFSEIDFRFRTTKQYGTDKDSGILGGVFSVYEPSWAVMAEASHKIFAGNCRVKAWDEGEDEIGGMPWPGTDAVEGNSYVTYKEQNCTERGTEKAVSDRATLTPTAFSEYHIRERS